MTGTPTVILVALALLVAIGCESAAKWHTVAEATGEWQVWTDEAGNQYRRTLLRYPNGDAVERWERMPAEAK